MNASDTRIRPFLTATAGPHWVAIPIEWVRGIDLHAEITKLPGATDPVLGAVRVSDAWLPLVDLRRVFGLPFAADERSVTTDKLAHLRQLDTAWVEALCASARAGTPFDGIHDPQQCEVGVWLANTEAPNARFRRLLEHVTIAHDALHRTAAEVDALVATGRADHVARRIQLLRQQEFSRFHILLDRASTLVSQLNRGAVVAVADEGRCLGIMVDNVHRVESFEIMDRAHDHVIAKSREGRTAVVLEMHQVWPGEAYANH